MKTKNGNVVVSLLVVLTYIIMIVVNALANILPINGKGTGEISDSYGNLFAPAGITFSIWGVIYLFLLGHCIFQFIRRDELLQKTEYRRVAVWFSTSSILNSMWIVAWHYEVLLLSLVIMLLILLSLIAIHQSLKGIKGGKLEVIFIRIPFAIYFGWITVATIANVTTLLVKLQWERFGLSEVFWTDAIVVIGALIGAISVLCYRTFSYGLVFLWAYLGILIKHTSAEGFQGKYPSVILFTVISMFLIVVAQIIMLLRKKEM